MRDKIERWIVGCTEDQLLLFALIVTILIGAALRRPTGWFTGAALASIVIHYGWLALRKIRAQR